MLCAIAVGLTIGPLVGYVMRQTKGRADGGVDFGGRAASLDAQISGIGGARSIDRMLTQGLVQGGQSQECSE